MDSNLVDKEKDVSNLIKHRRTSSEIISEAKGYLNNGVSVVKTKRPITPYSPNNHHLFGSVQINGRPVSSSNQFLFQKNIPLLPELQKMHYEMPVELQNNNKKDSPRLPSLTTNSPQVNTKEPVLKKSIFFHRKTSENKSIENDVINVWNVNVENLRKIVRDFQDNKQLSEESESNFVKILTELKSSNIPHLNKEEFLSYFFNMIECDSVQILLLIAELMLTLGENSNHLKLACRIIYKLSKNNENDKKLIESEIPELLLEKGIARINPIEDSESIVYGYGALRFLICSKSYGNLEPRNLIGVRLLSRGILQVLTIHLQLFNDTGHTRKLLEQHYHALFQLSETLRELFNFITTFNHRDHIKLDESCCLLAPQLIKSLEICMDETEMQLQILKTLSILSEVESCSSLLSERICDLGHQLKPLTKDLRTSRKGLLFICRVGYIIGNVVAQYDQARVLFFENNIVMTYLLDSLDFYANEKINDKPVFVRSRMDVLTKLTRIVANLCVNTIVGLKLGYSAIGVILLKILLQVKDHKTTEAEELLQAILGSIHNMSYYLEESQTCCSENPGSFHQRINDIASVLYDILQSNSKNIQLEAAKILGNVTRLSHLSDNLNTNKNIKILITCLNETENLEVLTAVVGILVNVLADWEKKLIFKELNGPKVMICVFLRALSLHNWNIAGLCCQAFWNFLIDCTNINEVMELEDGKLIGNCIAENLDERSLFNNNVPESWESFAYVASDLLERLQSLN